MTGGVSEKKAMFCREYLRTMSVDKAGEAAGFSERRAYEVFCEPEVQAEISRLREALAAGITADDAIRFMARLAFDDNPAPEGGKSSSNPAMDKLKLLDRLIELLGAGSGTAAEFLKALEQISDNR